MNIRELDDSVCRTIQKTSDEEIKLILDSVILKIINTDAIIRTEIEPSAIRFMVWHIMLNSYELRRARISRIFGMQKTSIKYGIERIDRVLKIKSTRIPYVDIYNDIVMPMIRFYFL